MIPTLKTQIEKSLLTPFLEENHMHPWLKEFYPIPAENAANSDHAALTHSLKKWTGLLPKNLEKYSCTFDAEYSEVIDDKGNTICSIDGTTCALCERHYVKRISCIECPLYYHLGKTCDESKNEDSFFRKSLKNPSLMVDALSACIKTLCSTGEKIKK